MAILTGGQVISEEVGLQLEKATLTDLGQAKKIVITKENTTIIDGAGESSAIESRIKQIKAQIEETSSDCDREKLQKYGPTHDDLTSVIQSALDDANDGLRNNGVNSITFSLREPEFIPNPPFGMAP